MREVLYAFPAYLCALAVAQVASGFSFTTSTPTQCQNLTLSWTGAPKGDLHFLLVPTVETSTGRILNMTIPGSSGNSYTFQLSQPSGLSFLATMWDDEGLGSGGSTEELTVGSSDDPSCLDSNVLADFFFQTTPTANPAACSKMTIEWGSNATRPISLVGMIPRGSVFTLPVSQDPNVNTFDWTVDIAEGTRVLLTMGDEGPYGTGGSTPLWTVGSGSSSCISDSSPKVAAGGNSTEKVDGVGGSSAGGSTTGDAGGSSDPKPKAKPIGAIVGGVVGGVAFLALVAVLVYCCVRRKSAKSKGNTGSVKSYSIAENGEKRRRHPMDLLGGVNSRADSPAVPAANLGDTRAERRNERLPVPSEAELDGSYYPSPFQYPSPPDTPSGAPRNTQNMAAFIPSARHSKESDQRSNAPSDVHPPASLSADTERATLGHSRSTHKPRVQITNPDQELLAAPIAGSTRTSTEVGTQEEIRPERPFMQHTDADVEELPPSYHDLKAGAKT